LKLYTQQCRLDVRKNFFQLESYEHVECPAIKRCIS
jgi:hypothetical protein